jgi:hypothetical protein
MIMANMQAWIVDGEYEKLDKINQYHVHNAWFEVFYGGCNYGTFSTAFPVEALHDLENGLIKHSLQVLFMDNMNKAAGGCLDQLALLVKTSDETWLENLVLDPHWFFVVYLHLVFVDVTLLP